MGVPVIWHARNLPTNGVIDIDKFTGFLPQRIFCNSEAIRTRFKSNRTKKITKTIMNGVDLEDYDSRIIGSEIREEFGIPSTAKVLGMSSRLGKDKGHLTLIKAIARLKNRYPDIWVLIVGGNVFEEDTDVPNFLKTKAHEFGVADRTVFTGFRNDVSRLYAAMDIFVLGTNAEPCGRVLFEAMAMKKPVVGTNNGGTPEIVVDGETGLLFNYGDAEELAVKIDYLFSSQELIQKMGNAGRIRVEENFTIEKNVQKTQTGYIELLEVKKC
jgi:glycosyltransferase involved in cell wall biosynthesis